MKVLKKCGWFVVSLLPVLLFFVIQVGASFVSIFVYMFLHYGDGLTQAELTMRAGEWAIENIMYLTLVMQIAAFLVFGIWYYFAYGKKKRPGHVEEPGGRQIAAIVLLGVLLQVVVSGALNLISEVAPGALEEYQELLENSGMMETSALVLLSVVIMAPIVEEILCRGIVFRLAKHVSVKFWVANVIQALLFGVLHANLVQGIYAFVFGLVLGYVYGKYERIWMCMLLHGVINFSSAIVSLLWGMLFLAGRGLAMTFMVVAMAAAVAGILYCIKEELGPVAKVPETAAISKSELEEIE
ncbi:MAG: CPBP family intramembrane metalloprotease [Ruminococcus sp.]|nr:CPBP family intramembrane metalloprotease [Ruminococcus sp.]